MDHRLRCRALARPPQESGDAERGVAFRRVLTQMANATGG
jgi:hypothetical protein